MTTLRERRGDPHFSKNKPLLKHLPLERVNAILRDPDWTRAVFFRDPARRLLSSYLDKFVQHRDYSVTVFGRKKGKRAGVDVEKEKLSMQTQGQT